MIQYSKTAFLVAVVIFGCSSISIADANLLQLAVNSAIPLAAQSESATTNEAVSLASEAESSINQQPLRSAYLLRLQGNAKKQEIQNADGIPLELQHHFDLVIDLLKENTDHSIEVALDRLEKSQGTLWTDQERQLWHFQLAEQRKQNIAHLQAYRQRGLFPLHEGHAEGPVPIFVDQHDTACAVGHLMRCSGWHCEVELIAATNLLVYVPDVKEGPLVDWVLTSGLTQEEAALIQPSYRPNIATTPIRELAGSEMSLDVPANWFDGSSVQDSHLIYENFRWAALVNSQWQFHTPQTPLIRHDPGDYIFGNSGTRTDFEDVMAFSYGGNTASYRPSWPHANIISLVPALDGEDPLNFLDTGFGIDGSGPFHIISFDIVSPDPDLKIDRVGVWAPVGLNAFPFQFQSLVVSLGTEVFYMPGAIPALVHFGIPPLGVLEAGIEEYVFAVDEAEDSAIFDGRDRVTVHTLIQGQRFGAMSHTVRLVADPETFPLGDVDRDGAVSFLDVSPFIALLSTGGSQIEADIDLNGSVDFLDIAPFIMILSQIGNT